MSFSDDYRPWVTFKIATPPLTEEQLEEARKRPHPFDDKRFRIVGAWGTIVSVDWSEGTMTIDWDDTNRGRERMGIEFWVDIVDEWEMPDGSMMQAER